MADGKYSGAAAVARAAFPRVIPYILLIVQEVYLCD